MLVTCGYCDLSYLPDGGKKFDAIKGKEMNFLNFSDKSKFTLFSLSKHYVIF